MAVMDTPSRVLVGALFMADASRARDQFGAVTKADIQAAVAAVDDWVVANAANYNGAIPLAARLGLTPAQKAELLLYVVRQRFLIGA